MSSITGQQRALMLIGETISGSGRRKNQSRPLVSWAPEFVGVVRPPPPIKIHLALPNPRKHGIRNNSIPLLPLSAGRVVALYVVRRLIITPSISLVSFLS